MIRICGIVGRNGCIALQPSENDAVQPVKAGMKGIGIGLWTHYILLCTTFRCPLVYEKKTAENITHFHVISCQYKQLSGCEMTLLQQNLMIGIGIYNGQIVGKAQNDSGGIRNGL